MKKLIITAIITLFTMPSFTAHAGFPDDLDDVVFIEEGAVPGVSNFVRSMAVTASLTVNIAGAHSFGGQNVIMSSSKANSWPVGGGNLSCCNANAWIVVKVGDTWYAGTWEFLRKGQTTKSTLAMVGYKHLRYAPLSSFQPRNGEIYGFFVSGITRNGLGRVNIRERSNVALFKFGEGPVDFDAVREEPEPEVPNITSVINSLLEE